MQGLTWMVTLACLAVAPNGWSSDTGSPGATCDRPVGVLVRSGCLPKPARPLRAVTLPQMPTPSVNNQYNYVYCPAPAVQRQGGGGAGSSGADSGGFDGFDGPDSSVSGKCADSGKSGSTKIDVHISKDIGLKIDTPNFWLALVAILAALSLAGFVYWLERRKGEGRSSAESTGLASSGRIWFVLLAMLLPLCVAAGYWWRGDTWTTLTTEQLARLVNSQEFGKAIEEFNQANEARAQLQAKVDGLEKDLAVARAESRAQGGNGLGGWSLPELLLTLVAVIAAVAFLAYRFFDGQVQHARTMLAVTHTSVDDALEVLRQVEGQLSDQRSEDDKRNLLLSMVSSAIAMLRRSMMR